MKASNNTQTTTRMNALISKARAAFNKGKSFSVTAGKTVTSVGVTILTFGDKVVTVILGMPVLAYSMTKDIAKVIFNSIASSYQAAAQKA